MNESRTSSRDNILDAAQRVAGRDGAGNLTLDKVACECGMSKGGLLYNFPNKDALLQAMLERLLQQHQQIMATEERMLAGESNATVKALLRSLACHQIADPDVYLSLLAASAQKPELLEPVRQMMRQQHQRLRDESSDAEMAMLLWAAGHGLLLQSILGISPYTESEKNHLFQRILEISGELS